MRYVSITRNNDFGRVYKRGKSFVHPQIVLYVNRNRAGHTRVGNRARRVIRHALYQVLPQDVGPVDLVLVARGQTPRLKSDKLAITLARLLQQAGVLGQAAR